MKRTILISLLTLNLAACHESLGIVGDAGFDAPTDVGDGTSDGTSDGWMDALPPPDAPVDVPPDGPTACPEPDEDILTSWSFDGATIDDGLDIDVPCVVQSVIDEPVEGYTLIELLCGYGLVEMHTIEFWANPHVWSGLWEGEEVTLKYRSDHFWWSNRWLAIHDTWGGLRLAAVDAEHVQPPGREDWYDPIEVRPRWDFCEHFEEPWGCGITERTALEVGFWDTRSIVFDSTYAYAGFLETVLVQIEESMRYVELWCEDAPASWHRAILVFYMEG